MSEMSTFGHSPRLTALLHCACADLHQGLHPFWGVSISPEDLAGHISEAVREMLTPEAPFAPAGSVASTCLEQSWHLTDSLNRFAALDGSHRMAAFSYLCGALDMESRLQALGEPPASPVTLVDRALRYAESSPEAWRAEEVSRG